MPFGTPLDQCWNFESVVFAEMCQLLGVTKTRTASLHPTSESMVERFYCTIEFQISKFADSNHRDWDVHESSSLAWMEPTNTCLLLRHTTLSSQVTSVILLA